MARRHRPDGSARDLPCHRRAVSSVHRDPHPAEVTTADEARRFLLVADQLQRHHNHQGLAGMSVCMCTVHVCVFACLVLCSQVCLCLLQAQGLSLSTASQSVSSGSQSTFSNNSCSFRDKAGKEHVYSTIGLYQVPALLTLHATLRKEPGKLECFGSFPQKSNDL